MKTIEEKIAVIQHFANGGKIEIRKNDHSELWGPIFHIPLWNWDHFDYRIYQEPKKKVKNKK